MPGMPPQTPTGRFEHSELDIQSIPISEGVSENMDHLAKLVKLHERAMQGALGIPKHLLEEPRG